MNLEKIINETEMIMILSGRLDVNTSKILEKELIDCIDEVQDIIFDFTDLEYISSAAIRVFVNCYKTITKKGGSMVLKNVNDVIMETLELTGFDSIFTIE